MAYLLLIISFFFENAYSLIIPNQNNLFLACFSLMSIFITYKLFKGNDKKYYLSCFIYGLCYDISLAGTFFVNALIFFLLGFVISKIYKNFEMNIFMMIIFTISIIIIYRFVSYLFFIASFHKSFDFLLLLKSFYRSIIVNVLYVLFLNIFVTKRTKKKKY